MSTLNAAFDEIAKGRHGDPFAVLGPHSARKNWTVRSWQPQAQSVELLDANNELLATMKKVHVDGLFEARLPLPIVAYRLRLNENGHPVFSGWCYGRIPCGRYDALEEWIV